MFTEIKRKSLIKSIVGAAVLFLAAIAILLAVFGNVFLLLTPAKSLDEITADDLREGLHVKGEVPYIVDYFAYMEDNGKTIETSFFIPMGEEGTICLIARGSTMKKATATMEATWNYLDYADVDASSIPSFKVNGILKNLTREDSKFFKEYLNDLDAEDREYIFPYGIYTGLGAGTDSNDYYMAIIGVVVLIVITIFVLWYGLSARCIAEINKYCKQQADPEYALSRIEQFYNMGTPVAGFRAGDEFFLAVRGNTTYFAEADECLWAYQQTTQHKTNGIPTGKTYSVLMKLANGEQLDIPMKKEAECKEVLDYINKMMPHLLIGYDDRLVRMYAKEREEMIRIVSERKAQNASF